ncbi:hypothetical protein [Ekhidna sp.]|uniref:hypothetical protein n=1 Tax=Ekhidna sp. TaxID=2608089 RepID=UPI003B5BD978
MKALVQNTVGILLIMAMAFMPADISAQRKHHHKKGGPPSWAPAHGYRAKKAVSQTARYMYNPDYNIYYDRRKEAYIYVSFGRWVISSRLPMDLNHRNVRDGFSVELAVNHSQPYSLNARHIKTYRKYSKRRYYAYCDR